MEVDEWVSVFPCGHLTEQAERHAELVNVMHCGVCGVPYTDDDKVSMKKLKRSSPDEVAEENFFVGQVPKVSQDAVSHFYSRFGENDFAATQSVVVQSSFGTDAAVSQLVDMGFDPVSSREALMRCNSDVSTALAILVGEEPPVPSPPVSMPLNALANLATPRPTFKRLTKQKLSRDKEVEEQVRASWKVLVEDEDDASEFADLLQRADMVDDQLDAEGTALHHAVKNMNAALVRRLAEVADVNVSNDSGLTPLHVIMQEVTEERYENQNDFACLQRMAVCLLDAEAELTGMETDSVYLLASIREYLKYRQEFIKFKKAKAAEVKELQEELDEANRKIVKLEKRLRVYNDEDDEDEEEDEVEVQLESSV